MLTARTQPEDWVKGIDDGAVEYITKPFNNQVLLALLRKVQRNHPRGRGRGAAWGVIYQVDGDLSIDFGAARLRLHGHPVSLTPTELRILRRLVDSQGQVVSNKELLRAIGGDEPSADVRVVKVHIRSLREKLGESAKDPRYIHNVRGLGYLFEPRR
jgi:two-component system alkaline phosphatase synthesis response regulator PhoP